jgi:hypothetical protein
VHESREIDKPQMVSNDDPHNEITLTAFRLVTMDLLELFKVMNEGTINVLGELHNNQPLNSLSNYDPKSIISRCRDLMRNEH